MDTISQRRRSLLKAAGIGTAVGISGFPAILKAANEPIKIGILAPRGGVAGTIGETGLRGVQWATERINANGGIGGRPVKLIIEEETTPKETIERYRRLVMREGVDCVQGVVSTGAFLALAPEAEDSEVITISWDGTTQDGVTETMYSPRYVFRSTDNECEAVMASLLAIKHYGNDFVRIAGMNPDYSYGRNVWAAFQALLDKYDIEYEVVSEQWSKVGNLDLTSNVAALNAAKPDLIYSSLLFADLPVFMKQAHDAGLSQKTRFVLPAAGWQLSSLKKDFMPEGVIYGQNTMDFNDPNGNELQTEFVQWYQDNYNDSPSWEADRAYFSMEVYKKGVERALEARNGSWPTMEEIAEAMGGIEVETLGGKGGMRTDNVAEQMFHQGLTTNDNEYDFATITNVTSLYSDKLQKPKDRDDFWEWLDKTHWEL